MYNLFYFICPDICLAMTRHVKEWRQFDRDSSPVPTEWNAAISAVCPTSLHANTVSGCCSVRIQSRGSCILLKRLWVQFWLHTLRTTVQNFHKRGKLGKLGSLKNVGIYHHVKCTNKRHSFLCHWVGLKWNRPILAKFSERFSTTSTLLIIA